MRVREWRDLSQRAVQLYRKEGARSLAQGVYKSLGYRWNPLIHTLQYLAVDREQMVTDAKSRGEYYPVDPPTKVTVDVEDEESLHENLALALGTKESTERFVCVIPDIELVGPNALPQVRTGKFLLEPYGDRRRSFGQVVRLSIRESSHRSLISNIVRSVPEGVDGDSVTSLGTVTYMNTRHAHNYGHWLLEDLPRLKAIEEYRRQTGEVPTLLIDSETPAWMKQMLSMFGYSDDDLIEWQGNKATVDRLILPSIKQIGSFGIEPDPAGHRWVRDKIVDGVDVDSVDKSFSNRVVISRQRMERKRIMNFDEMMAALEPLGFESYRPEELSRAAQIKLFQQADVIVGQSGSAFSNIIFSSDLTLVEMFPWNKVAPSWFVIANEFDHEYEYLTAPLACEDTYQSYPDIEVDVDTVEATVRRAIAEPVAPN